ncbi:hypothetical protein Tco_1004319 [Tanacetum coccineum]|uniref:Uncharacterized protein n=1 Tax=Tanacetum coccineum TaxID=301880 RepID=A0ABQ5FBJ6_9ASTR
MEEYGDKATSRLRIHEIIVKDASNMSYDELVSWDEEEAEMKTPKKKVLEHVVDDVDIPLMNLVESPIFKPLDTRERPLNVSFVKQSR